MLKPLWGGRFWILERDFWVSLVAALPPDILCVHSRFDVYCLHVVGPDPVAVVVAGITQLLLTDNPVDF